MGHQVSPLAPAAFPAACRRFAACSWRLAKRASATRTVPTCCWRSWTRAQRWRAASPNPSRARPRSTGASKASSGGTARAVVINAGNANAFTGKAGVATVTAVASAAAQLLKCKPAEIFQASTGVIGEPLNPAPITDALPKLMAAARVDAWSDAARAIMTTDTFAKACDGHGEARRQDGHHQRHRQGLRHDRARHGDHAGLHLHRCGNSVEGPAEAAVAQRWPAASTASRSMAIPRRRTRC